MRNALKSEKIFSRMVEIRRAIHSCPELAFEEEKTALFIMEELDRLSIPYEYRGLGHGVIGRIGNADHVPAVALRTEMGEGV
jgi:hippurate hydrolase